MAAWEGKRYELYEPDADSYNEFLIATGVNLMTRRLARISKPTIELSQNGNIYTLTITETSPLETTVSDFELDKRFDTVTIDGIYAQSSIEMISPDKFKQEIYSKHQIFVITYEFTPDECITTMQVDDIVVVRKYAAV